MKFIVRNLKMPLDANEVDIKLKVAKELRFAPESFKMELYRRSLDSRHGEVAYVYSAIVDSPLYVSGRNVSEFAKPAPIVIDKYPFSDRPVVVGFGPAGIFAALILARSGARPIVLERGKKVEERALDVELLKTNSIFNPESNVSYGEGGAGTFSDGKLNTNLNDPAIRFVLEEFVAHGAERNILIDALPHIGSDYLQKIVKNFREEIISLGGEVLFRSEFTHLKIERGAVTGVRYLDSAKQEKELPSDHVFLALGHSPFSTMENLLSDGLTMEPKDFSIGVRIEHPQSEINKAAYHELYKDPRLPAASYRGVIHLRSGRGVYTFCMCPGGYVVNSSSESDTIVTNGMSNNARENKNGNSALLVSVHTSDFFHGNPLDGWNYRKSIERSGFCGDKAYFAPATTVLDFMSKRMPTGFGNRTPSYQPGVYLSNLGKLLPAFAEDSLIEALSGLRTSLPFFADPAAVLTGFETRSSSPSRIVRDQCGESNIKGVFPLGEGAGYAGGITSSALDAIKNSLNLLARGKY